MNKYIVFYEEDNDVWSEGHETEEEAIASAKKACIGSGKVFVVANVVAKVFMHTVIQTVRQ